MSSIGSLSEVMRSYKVPVVMLLAAIHVTAQSATADLVIEIPNVAMTAGSTGTVDILIHSTGSDPLQIFGYTLQITQLAEVGGSLQFADSFSSMTIPRQSNSEISDSSYVFAGNSGFFSAQRQVDVKALVGSDFTADGLNVGLGTNNRLLARVELQHLTLNPNTSSGTYQVSLVAGASTLFQDEDANDIPVVSGVGAIASGLVTVGAVPEPAAWCLMLLVTALAYAARRWHLFGSAVSTTSCQRYG